MLQLGSTAHSSLRPLPQSIANLRALNADWSRQRTGIGCQHCIRSLEQCTSIFCPLDHRRSPTDRHNLSGRLRKSKASNTRHGLREVGSAGQAKAQNPGIQPPGSSALWSRWWRGWGRFLRRVCNLPRLEALRSCELCLQCRADRVLCREAALQIAGFLSPQLVDCLGCLLLTVERLPCPPSQQQQLIVIEKSANFDCVECIQQLISAVKIVRRLNHFQVPKGGRPGCDRPGAWRRTQWPSCRRICGGWGNVWRRAGSLASLGAWRPCKLRLQSRAECVQSREPALNIRGFPPPQLIDRVGCLLLTGEGLPSPPSQQQQLIVVEKSAHLDGVQRIQQLISAV